MITIITGNPEEYEQMMDVAQEYICRQLSFRTCNRYRPGECDQCYKDNHVKCGISVFPAVDDRYEDEL